MANDQHEIILEMIKDRANGYLEELVKGFRKYKGTYSLPIKFYLAGGCFKYLHHQRDCDLDLFAERWNPCPDAHSTKNAQSTMLGSRSVQLCKYWKPELSDMIKSFDFSHTQVGVTIQLVHGTYVVSDVNCTDKYLAWLRTGNTYYQGSEYPLSSLLRAAKLLKNGMLSQAQYRFMAIDILADVVDRGFESYADMKDQLDSVDLNIEINNVAASANKILTKLQQPGIKEKNNG